MTLSQAECLSECSCEVENRFLESEKQKLWYLYERAIPDLKRIAKTILQREFAGEREDVMQDVFLLYAHRAATGQCRCLDGQRIRDIEDSDLDDYVAACCSYLKRIMINRCRKVRRQFQQRATCELPAKIQCQEPDLDVQLGDDEQREFIQGEVDRLPEPLRDVVTLHYYDNLSGSEIAAALDIPEGTVRSRLYNGRKQLKEPLEEKLVEYA